MKIFKNFAQRISVKYKYKLNKHQNIFKNHF